MSVTTRSISTAAVAVVLALAAFIGELPLAIVMAAALGVFAFGWPGLVDAPWPWGTRIVLGLTAVGTLMTALTLERGITALPFVVAVGVIVAFISEMLRGDGRARVVESLCGAVGGVVVVASGGGWLAAAHNDDGAALVVVAAACIAVGSAVSGALPWRGWLNVLITVAASVGTGAGLGSVLPDTAIAPGAWAGFVAGILVAALYVLFDRLPQLRRRSDALAAVMVPVLIGGMLIYIVGAILSPVAH